MLLVTPETIKMTLEAHLVMEPAGRREATIASMVQVAGMVRDPFVHLALACAFERLSRAQPTDIPPTTARRATLRDLATALRCGVEGNVDPITAQDWFQCQIDAWKDSEDPRQQAMYRTAVRELSELRAWV